jgi:DNA-directed RNA polymerase specialized sigma24 family protein
MELPGRFISSSHRLSQWCVIVALEPGKVVWLVLFIPRFFAHVDSFLVTPRRECVSAALSWINCRDAQVGRRRDLDDLFADIPSGAVLSVLYAGTDLCQAGVWPMQRSNFDDERSLSASRFHTTRWSVVLLAGQEQSSERTAALERLCAAYWFPIYGFARRKGCGDEDAKDLTQQFFSRLLERNDFAGLDPQRGKFRTFLLTAFTHFLANEIDRSKTIKRGGGKIILSFNELSSGQLGQFEPATDCPPAKVFDVHWAQAVLERALARLREEMVAADKSGHFESLKKFLTADAAGCDYGGVARELGVADASVPVLVHRLRQRYRQLVRAEVAQTVSSPAELEEEMRHLFDVLNQ